MKQVPYLPEPGQVIINLFDFTTGIYSVGIKDDNVYIRAPNSSTPFDPLELFRFGQTNNTDNQNKELKATEVYRVEDDNIKIEVSDKFFEYLPSPNVESIKLVLIKAQLKPLGYPGILEIKGVFVIHLIEDGFLATVRAGFLYTFPDSENQRESEKDFTDLLRRHDQPKPAKKAKPKKQPAEPGVPDVKPAKPDRRKKKREPKEISEYYLWLLPKSRWRVIYREMYKQSQYGPIRKNPFYAGKKVKKGRYYSYGIKRLADLTGLAEITIRKNLKVMRENNIIKRRQQGWPGRGNTIYELPLDMRHVMSWKREHKTK